MSINPFRSIPRFILVIVILTVILAVFIGADLFPYLRGGWGWRWPYVPASVLRTIPLVLATILYIAGSWLLLRNVRRPRLILAWAMLAAVILPLLVIVVRFDNPVYELFARTISRMTSGFQAAAATIGWDGPQWRDWASFIHIPEWDNGHVAVAAPGIPLLFSWIGAALDHLPAITQPLYRALLPWQCQNYEVLSETPGELASAWAGILMPLWGSLAVLPLYAIANHFPRTKRWALGIVLWFPLIPSVLMFAPDWNTFYPFVSLSIFGLLILGIERRRWYWLVLSGLIMGIALFMVYSFIALAALMGFYTLLYTLIVERRSGPVPWYRPVIVGLWFALGISVPWLLYWAWSGTTPPALVATSFSTHLGLERPYLPWVFLHYWDWTLFNGFALMGVWYVGLWTWQRNRRAPDSLSDMPVLAISLLATVVLLAVSGTARGESGRVWSFFTPFALLAAADGLDRRLGDRPQLPSWLALTLVHAGLMLVLVFSLNVIDTELTHPPAAPTAVENVNAVNADFSAGDGSGQFRLVGWSGKIDGDKLTLNLRWQGVQMNTRPYWFGAVLVAPDNSTHNAGIWQPGGKVEDSSGEVSPGTYPTTCWAPGSIVGDTVVLTLPTQKPSGPWWVSLAAFGDPTQSEGRLQVTLPSGQHDTQVGLGPITAQ